MLDWTVLRYGAETLRTGLYTGPMEDKIGSFLWQDRWTWDIGQSGREPLNFTLSVKFTMELHPSVRVSGNSFPHNTTTTPLTPIAILSSLLILR